MLQRIGISRRMLRETRRRDGTPTLAVGGSSTGRAGGERGRDETCGNTGAGISLRPAHRCHAQSTPREPRAGGGRRRAPEERRNRRLSRRKDKTPGKEEKKEVERRKESLTERVGGARDLREELQESVGGAEKRGGAVEERGGV